MPLEGTLCDDQNELDWPTGYPKDGQNMFTLYDFFFMNLFLHTAKQNSHSILIVINEYKTEPDLCSTDII